MPKPHNAYIGNTSPGWEWSTEPHWEDLVVSPIQGSGGAALTFAAYRDTPFKFPAFRNAQNDELHLSYQVPHAWDPGTMCKFHLHMIPLTDPASAEVVRFDGQYVWAGIGDEVPANSGWTQFGVDYSVAPGYGNKHVLVPVFSTTPAASKLESSLLLVYIKRSGGAAADTYSGNMAMGSLDLHIQRVKMGTLNEYPWGT